jgi:hypothetical protein
MRRKLAWLRAGFWLERHPPSATPALPLGFGVCGRRRSKVAKRVCGRLHHNRRWGEHQQKHPPDSVSGDVSSDSNRSDSMVHRGACSLWRVLAVARARSGACSQWCVLSVRGTGLDRAGVPPLAATTLQHASHLPSAAATLNYASLLPH